MDYSYPYIASLTREPFLFYEMRSTAKLMAEGNSDDAIVKEIVEQNLFQYPTEKSITRMAKACIKRLHALEDDSLVSAIASQPTDVAKQICLYADIEKWYADFLKTDKAKECIRVFDQTLPDYSGISDIKKIDSILWSIR